MRRRRVPGRGLAAMLALVSICGVAAAPAKKGVKLQGNGSILMSIHGPAKLILSGKTAPFGRYNAFAELQLMPGPTAGSLVGTGVAVVVAENGDQIVGNVTWQTDGDGGGQIGFSWRNAIELSDGTIVGNSGRFIKNRPAGASSDIELMHEGTHATHTPKKPLIVIIAILIG